MSVRKNHFFFFLLRAPANSTDHLFVYASVNSMLFIVTISIRAVPSVAYWSGEEGDSEQNVNMKTLTNN